MTQPKSFQQLKYEQSYKIIPKFKCVNCGLEVKPNIRENGKMNCTQCRTRIRVRNRSRNCRHFNTCEKCHHQVKYSETRLYS